MEVRDELFRVCRNEKITELDQAIKKVECFSEMVTDSRATQAQSYRAVSKQRLYNCSTIQYTV